MRNFPINKNLGIYKLTKDDINSLVKDIEGSFKESVKIRLRISATIKNVELNETSVQSFWNHPEASDTFNNLSILVSGDNMCEVSVYMFKKETVLHVASVDEIWSNGVGEKISNFFKSRNSNTLLLFGSSTCRSVLIGALAPVVLLGTFLLISLPIKVSYTVYIPLWSIDITFAIFLYSLFSIENKINIKINTWTRAEKLSIAGTIATLVSVIVTVLAFLEPNIQKQNSIDEPADSLTQATTTISASSISVDKIIKDINNAKAFQRNSTIGSYIGVPIAWEVTLSSVTNSTDTNVVRLQMINKGGSELVICTVNVDQYPQLKSLDKQESFIVHGIIDDIPGGVYFLLKDCKLIFR